MSAAPNLGGSDQTIS